MAPICATLPPVPRCDESTWTRKLDGSRQNGMSPNSGGLGMGSRGWKWLGGTAAALVLLVNAVSSGAANQGERAADGKTLSGEPAETQAIFRDVWGADADRQWVPEHHAIMPA